MFLRRREMRCLRHKIHTNLFLSLLTSNLCWILIAVIQVSLIITYTNLFLSLLTSTSAGSS
jgi:hypothetical protein